MTQKEKRFSFRIPEKLYEKIKRAAAKERRSVNQWLVLRLEESLRTTRSAR